MLFYYIVFIYHVYMPTYAVFYYDYGILLYYVYISVMVQVFPGIVIALRAPR